MRNFLLSILIISCGVANASAVPGISSEPFELTGTSGNSRLTLISSDVTADQDRHRSLFADPAARMRKIKQLFADAGRQILELKQQMDKHIARIAANEQAIMQKKGMSEAEARRLTGENIRLFNRIEQARLRIVEIQLHTARTYLNIETRAYNRISDDVKKQLQLIKRNPANYWLDRRNLLFNDGELESLLPEAKIRPLYR